MKPRDFFDLAVKMRYAQKHYFKETDKDVKQMWLKASRAYETQMDNEICRVKGILIKKAEKAYELVDVESTKNCTGEKWFEEHIFESLTKCFSDDNFVLGNHYYMNGFNNDSENPTLVIKDFGEQSADYMLEFEILSAFADRVKLRYKTTLKG